MLSSADLSAADRWVAAGIITDEQARLIKADLAAHAPRRGFLAAEGLGYVGGVIVLVGLLLLLSLSWQNLTTGGRVAVTAGVTIAFVVAGVLIPAGRLGTTGTRLRGVLWAFGSVGAAITLGLVGDEVLDLAAARVMLLATGGALVLSAVLWVFNRHVLQHVMTFASALPAAYWGTDTVLGTDGEGTGVLPGLAMWLVGAVWFALSLADIVPRRAGGALGSIGVIIGSLTLLGESWGAAFALATVVALVVIAVLRRELAVLAIGSLGTLIVLPAAVDEYLGGGTPKTALALVAAGLALVATAIYTARRRPASSGA